MKWWWNGQLYDEQEAVIPLADHGFLYGIGLFETFRTYDGRPFLLQRHIERLLEGCGELRIAYRPDSQEIEEAIARLLEANGLRDAYFRWSVSAGAAPFGLPSASGYGAPNAALMAKPLPAQPPEPKSLYVLQLPRSTPEGRVRRKSFHYMNNILAKWELSERTSSASAEGLFTTEDNVMVEGIVSNVFYVSNEVLYTPSLGTGCLPGVTRWAVTAAAARLGIPIMEGRYAWQELLHADELFVTNSVQEITPVRELADAANIVRREWGTVPGPVTALLRGAYQEWTRRRDWN